MNSTPEHKPECPACKQAEKSPTSGYYMADCLECSCRALAQSPEAWKAINALSNVPLQQAMQRLANGDVQNYEQIRKRVWHWIGKTQGVKA